jgi:hypothetical protein
VGRLHIPRSDPGVQGLEELAYLAGHDVVGNEAAHDVKSSVLVPTARLLRLSLEKV